MNFSAINVGESPVRHRRRHPSQQRCRECQQQRIFVGGNEAALRQQTLQVREEGDL